MNIYTAKVIEKVNIKPGCWAYNRIGVFCEGVQIGEYQRNYDSFMDTFHPFRLNGKDLAIYSPDYTCTRIMELPSCKDIGGEEPVSHGFCPTGYYIPSYVIREFDMQREGKKETHRYRLYDPPPEEMRDTADSKVVSDLLFTDFGFISGCIWGEDHSWKLECLDLSQADKGILKRDARFGYLELPSKMELKDAVEIDGYGDESENIRISSTSYYNFKTGKRHE